MANDIVFETTARRFQLIVISYMRSTASSEKMFFSNAGFVFVKDDEMEDWAELVCSIQIFQNLWTFFKVMVAIILLVFPFPPELFLKNYHSILTCCDDFYRFCMTWFVPLEFPEKKLLQFLFGRLDCCQLERETHRWRLSVVRGSLFSVSNSCSAQDTTTSILSVSSYFLNIIFPSFLCCKKIWNRFRHRCSHVA